MKVLALAVRPVKEGPMREVEEVVVSPESGVDGDHGRSTRRGITLLAARQWETVTRELGADLPWHARRANVLVDADSLASLIGTEIDIADVRIEVLGETDPCAKMDRRHVGLREALMPDCRGGVYGRIVRPGTIRIGDAVTGLDLTP